MPFLLWLIMRPSISVIFLSLLSLSANSQDLSIYQQGLFHLRQTVEVNENSLTHTIASLPNGIIPESIGINQSHLPPYTMHFVKEKNSLAEILTALKGTSLNVEGVEGTIQQIMDGKLWLKRGNELVITDLPTALPWDIISPYTQNRLNLKFKKPAAKTSFQLSYLSHGLDWQANYQLFFSETEESALKSNINIYNHSDIDFSPQAIDLIAGNLNLPQEPPTQIRHARAEMAFDSMGGGSKSFEVSNLQEQKRYRLKTAEPLYKGEITSIEFYPRTPLKIIKKYVHATAIPLYHYPMQQGQVHNETSAMIELSTKEKLTMDLPEGNIFVFDAASEQLIGSSTIQNMAQGESLRIVIGEAYNIKTERKQKSFTQQKETNFLRLTETYEITAQNFQDKSISLEIRESMPRWRDWNILTASDPYQKTEQGQIETTLNIAPQEKKVFTYTVEYRIPN